MQKTSEYNNNNNNNKTDSWVYRTSGYHWREWRGKTEVEN